MSALEIVQAFCTQNDCYKANVARADKRYVKFQDEGPKGLMLHSVGCAQPDASVFVRKWDKPNYSACAHAVIDANSGIVMQTLPWNFRGWHCGSGSKGAAASCNNTHIGVEMCESKWIKYTGHLADFEILDKAKAQEDCKRTYNAAVELFAMLCQTFDLDPLTAIMSHKEGGKAGIASGHVDPEHYWTQLGMNYTMDGFRQAVKDKLAETPESPETGFPFVDVPEKAYYRKAVEWAYANGITAGTSKTMFSPDRPITRAEAVTMMRRLYKLIEGGG